MTAPAETGPAGGPGRRPARRHRSRASVLSQVATLAVVAIAVTALDRVAGSADLRRFLVTGVACLTAGALVATVTPLSRPFRRVSAWLAAVLVAGALAFLAWDRGSVDVDTWHQVFAVGLVVLGLDLCWVARLRVWVFVSAVALIPVLTAPGGYRMVWAAGWLAAAFVALWLLANDERRAIDRPTWDDPTERPKRGAGDLARIGIGGLTVGIALALVMSSPGYSFRPLERLIRYLPFRPDLDLTIDSDLDIRDYEIDANGNEVRYRVDPEGRRFVLDPYNAVAFAVIERDGADDIVDVNGTTVATVRDGASVLEVPASGAAPTTTYQRDDHGWYLDAGESRYHLRIDQGRVRILRPEGLSLGSDGDVIDLVGEPGFGPLRAVVGPFIGLPPAAVVDGTAGGGTVVIHDGDAVEVHEGHRRWRRYERRADGLDVTVVSRGRRLEYSWNADRSTMTVRVPDLGQSGSLDIDRTGNAFDGLEAYLDAARSPDSSPGPDWEALARNAVLAVGATGALALAVRTVRRRRRAAVPSDRDWAERELARIEAYGARQGCARLDVDSPVAYVDRLARAVDEAVRDGADGAGDGDRLRRAGDVLDRALFGAHPLTDAERDAVTQAVDGIVDAGDRPGRGVRRPPTRPPGTPDAVDDQRPAPERGPEVPVG